MTDTTRQADADRELLEMAAKAAGLKLGEWHGSGFWLDLRDTPYGPAAASWNPLADDGDALRLAVQLRMDIFAHGDSVETFTMRNRIRASGTALLSPDPCAATRRAIVRAAAEIGRSQHG